MAQDLAENLAVKLDLVQTTWATMAADLATKCDIAMGGISITLERAKHALYSSPYLRDGKAAAIGCADRSKYETLADIDLPGVRVVVNPGGTNAEFDSANIHHATIVQYPDNNTIFDQVSGDNAVAMITDASEIRWQIKQNPQLCGSSIDHPFTFESSQDIHHERCAGQPGRGARFRGGSIETEVNELTVTPRGPPSMS
jgi:cyclohexadienyl dehydratase